MSLLNHKTVQGQTMKSVLKGLLIAFSIYLLLLWGFSQLFVPQVTGVKVHEWTGVAILVMVAVHVYLLRSFFSFFTSQKAPYFIYRDVIIVALILTFVTTVFTGLSISHYVVPGLIPIPRGIALQIHTTSTTYMVIAIGMHLGCYVSKFYAWFNDAFYSAKARFPRLPSYLLRVALYLMALNGITQVTTEDYLNKLTATQSFSFYDYDRLFILNVVDQVSILVLFMMVSSHLASFFLMRSLKKEKRVKANKDNLKAKSMAAA